MNEKNANLPVIDARGLACPEPVVLTRQAAQAHKHFVVLVDNRVAVQNITRFCTNRRLDLQVAEEGAQFRLEIRAK